MPILLVPQSANLKHAREMIKKAASGNGGAKPKPDLVVLPVGDVACWREAWLNLTRRVGMLQFAVWARPLPGLCRDDWLHAGTEV